MNEAKARTIIKDIKQELCAGTMSHQEAQTELLAQILVQLAKSTDFLSKKG